MENEQFKSKTKTIKEISKAINIAENGIMAFDQYNWQRLNFKTPNLN